MSYDIDTDLRAREILSDRIGNTGALMIDEYHAYLDNDADYPAAAAALGCDIEDVNDMLFATYQDLLRNA